MQYGKLTVDFRGRRIMFITVGDIFIVYNGLDGRTYACRIGDVKCPFDFVGEATARLLASAKFSHDTGNAEVRRGLWSWLINIGGELFALVELDNGLLASYLGDWNEAMGVIPTLDYPEEVINELLQLISEMLQRGTFLKIVTQ